MIIDVILEINYRIKKYRYKKLYEKSFLTPEEFRKILQLEGLGIEFP